MLRTKAMTLKKIAAARFNEALDAYQFALASKDAHAIVAASLTVHAARRNKADSTAVNRAFREAGKKIPA